MGKPSIPFLRGLISLTLIAIVCIAGHLSFLKQAQKLNQLETQTKIIFNTQIELYKNLVTFDSILERSKAANQKTIKEILSKINEMSDKNQIWKDEYNIFLDSLKKGINDLNKVELN